MADQFRTADGRLSLNGQQQQMLQPSCFTGAGAQYGQMAQGATSGTSGLSQGVANLPSGAQTAPQFSSHAGLVSQQLQQSQHPQLQAAQASQWPSQAQQQNGQQMGLVSHAPTHSGTVVPREYNGANGSMDNGAGSSAGMKRPRLDNDYPANIRMQGGLMQVQGQTSLQGGQQQQRRLSQQTSASQPQLSTSQGSSGQQQPKQAGSQVSQSQQQGQQQQFGLPQGQMGQSMGLAFQEPTPEPEAEEHEETALDKVEKISSTLRAMLGKGFAGADESALPEEDQATKKKPSGPDPNSLDALKQHNPLLSAEDQAKEDAATLAAAGDAVGGSLVRRDDLVTACGEAASYLKSYQLVGINFLTMLHRSGTVGGAILADEMGLGKTAQTICFLGTLRTLENNRNPHLVVCPASLIENWQRELGRWCPQLRVVLYYGKDRADVRKKLMSWRRRVRTARREGSLKQEPPGVILPPAEEDLQDDESDKDPDADLLLPVEDRGEPSDDEDSHYVCGLKLPAGDSGESPFDVMLATYTMFERESDYKEDRLFLLKWKWSYIVADENRSSIRTKKIRRVAAGCEHRLLLTGTPLQNSLEELRALLEFIMPSLFSGNDEDNDHGVPVGEDEQEAAIERYRSLLAPFILRRLKSEVASQLAKKKQVFAGGRPKGSANKPKVDVDKEAGGEPLPSPTPLTLTKLSSQRVNNIFTHLRKVAQHPLLVRNRYTDEQVYEMAEIASSSALYAATYPMFLGKFILPSSCLMSSTKLVYLAELLPRLKAEGSRVLLFSQWTTVLDVLEWFMELHGFTYVRLDGDTQVDERLNLVDKFNNPDNGVDLFLLSTRAGGQGLNLTGADVVVLHDVDFNPQVDQQAEDRCHCLGQTKPVTVYRLVDRQAEDRCHRLGQTKPVTVYRLVTKGTVDESIIGIADRKLALDAAVLEGFTLSSAGDAVEADDDAVSGEDKGKKKKKKEGGSETKYMGAILASLLADA
eukprot:gene9154-16279_t